MESVTIEVPSSSANVGLGFDIWALGLGNPALKVTYTRLRDRGSITIENRSPLPKPLGRELGYAAREALNYFRKADGISEGAHILFEDTGYPTGGLGRSGAEAVGVVMAAAIFYRNSKSAIRGVLSRDEIIRFAAKGEPNEHKDNVAASTNGRFNIVYKEPYENHSGSVDFYDVPENLGIAIGYSSHQKSGGTEALREAMKQPVEQGDFIQQTGLISAATAALVTGNVEKFLAIVWGDRYHEPRRAAKQGYGNFSESDLHVLKRIQYDNHGIATVVSGAGPNLAFLYDRGEYSRGMEGSTPAEKAVVWAKDKGIDLLIKDTPIAKEGAYDYAQRVYGYGK
ncbi:hypothetical protein HYV81_02050 [Candidatus Woesearchaeota archaeon]|nr:hypothetical protein [Candidatus Woesearchaeota archaeon]